MFLVVSSVCPFTHLHKRVHPQPRRQRLPRVQIPPASPISSYPRAPRARPSAHSSSQESVPPELRGPGIFVSRTPRPSRTPAVPLSISKRRSSSTSSRTRSVESSAIVITGESNQRHRKPQFVVKQIPPGQEAHLAGSPSHYVSHQ